MNKSICLIFFGLIIMSHAYGQENDQIKELFNLKCGICHTVGGGKLVGPDLKDIDQKRSQDWLVEFIRSSQTMIKSGDKDAVEVYEANNKVLMPDPEISDSEILSLISYVKDQSSNGGSAVSFVSVLDEITEDNIENGRKLFEGRKRFENGGPSCISCHNGFSNYFFSENSFSTKEIKTSFSNLGEAGVRAILENPPFPVMKKAFESRSLGENEIKDIMAFMQQHGASQSKQTPASGYILYGLGGAILLMFLYALIWYERRSKSVNNEIYKRQIRSAN